jgi:hypothetical protein
MRWPLPAVLGSLLLAGACAPRSAVQPSGTPEPPGAGPPVETAKAAPAQPGPGDIEGGPVSGGKEAFPHVRVDRVARVVEVDGIVPIDAHDAETPDVYLEVLVCTRDSKEHESLVMTDARPSQVHAALLLLGLEPGRPGSVAFDGATLRRTAPTGDAVAVTIAYRDARGREVEAPASDWVVNKATGAGLGGAAWVFSGSRFVVRNGKEWYDADGAGTLVGLATFGGETIARVEVQSPESAVDEPEWIADAARVPAFGTPVVVRIRPAK